MAVFLHKQNGKFSADNHNEMHLTRGENGMKCHQNGMKCLQQGINDETTRTRRDFLKGQLAPTINTIAVITAFNL
ncbi:hypothetical protein [Citrobacter rodentium]|jgi:hypothetical protein|uniref:Uncharacterized protein n=1 Tax=Citrobacter rodentium TaxID=67825 RepID=A0A482PII0_CITRO|nr:hypothetical protein [Citrobacter rodentium]QBY30541.1 hypothetical protein E2R62_18040 [Citrobacter rodentium]UHO32088.1 hypothetical protein K7R23_05135 [Citrobacter rodentium NBRC 105723 = DSM 16636]HAT8013057.1 hypothetical protein [Citrobacter rodentium NBRC 105723 = DSM 16636]HAT8018199.1 hypothetical protein [Citrobacter rodentium]HAT8027664.1 hypothetical protein [Citrobacter rodentium]